MVHVNVFKQCLKNVGRYDPRVVPEETVKQLLTRAKSCVAGKEWNSSARDPSSCP